MTAQMPVANLRRRELRGEATISKFADDDLGAKTADKQTKANTTIRRQPPKAQQQTIVNMMQVESITWTAGCMLSSSI